MPHRAISVGVTTSRNLQCVCTPSYYARAIKTMNESVNPELYVIFSDDIQWCKENIREMVGNREVVFVDWNKG